jgi:hypothetical protein
MYKISASISMWVYACKPVILGKYFSVMFHDSFLKKYTLKWTQKKPILVTTIRELSILAEKMFFQWDFATDSLHINMH